MSPGLISVLIVQLKSVTGGGGGVDGTTGGVVGVVPFVLLVEFEVFAGGVGVGVTTGGEGGFGVVLLATTDPVLFNTSESLFG